MGWKLKGKRGIRTGAVLAVLVLAAGGLLLWGRVPSTADRVRRAQAALDTLARDFALAKEHSGQDLREINANNCSECPCKGGRQLRGLSNADPCAGNWNKALMRLYRLSLGQARVPDQLLRDPWGSPFLLHENEGTEGLPPCTPDTITSVGPDGIQGTGDDLTRDIPLAHCPKEDGPSARVRDHAP